MKVSKRKLKQMIKEEFEWVLLNEADGHGAGSALSLKALVPLAEAMAHDTGANMWDISEILAELVKREFYGGQEGRSPYKKV